MISSFRTLLSFLLLAFLLSLNAACTGRADNAGEEPSAITEEPPAMTIVTPVSIKTDGGTVVNNPGKGWTPYVGSGQENLISYGAGGIYDDVLDLGTVGYTRFNWKEVQPDSNPHSFDWSKVETAKNAWKAIGKQFAFRIMAANSHGGAGEQGKYITPKWVFENNPWGNSNYYVVDFANDDFNGHPGEKALPVWNDPSFIAAVDNLAKALAAKYGNDPDIAFIDIGTYGNWGEKHLYPFDLYESGKNKDLNPAEIKKHHQIYADAFSAAKASARLVAVFGLDSYQPVYDYAIDNWGMSIRRDGVIGWKGGELDGFPLYSDPCRSARGNET
jgi:hypothetical protein